MGGIEKASLTCFNEVATVHKNGKILQINQAKRMRYRIPGLIQRRQYAAAVDLGWIEGATMECVLAIESLSSPVSQLVHETFDIGKE